MTPKLGKRGWLIEAALCTKLQLVTDMRERGRRTARRANASGARGVSLNRRDGRWMVSIRHMRRQRYLGSFADLDVAKKIAAAAYDVLREYSVMKSGTEVTAT